MNEANRVTADEFQRSVISLSYIFSAPALVIVFAFLLTLLDMTSQQWQWFFGATGTYAVLCSYPLMMLQKRIMAPVTDYLELSAPAQVSAE